jgi:DNA-binding transcriptional ArsR family regulator
MGITKIELFTEEQNEIATIAKVLGHPARIAILQYIAKSSSCINTNLVKELGLAQATISQHLRELKSAGIIQGTIEGTAMNYCINPIKWKEIETVFAGLFSSIQNPKTTCC